MADTPAETSLIVINNVCSTASLLAGAWVLGAYIRTWKYWSYTGKMIVCLTVSDFLYAISNLLSNLPNDSIGCPINGFLRLFSSLSSFIWSAKIAHTAYQAFHDEESVAVIKKDSWVRFLVWFGIPLAFAFIPLLPGPFSYGPVSLDCGIRSPDKVWERIVFFTLIFAPMAIGLSLTIYYYSKLLALTDDFEDFRIEKKQFFLYPMGQFIAWLPGLIFGVVVQSFGYYFWLDILRVMFTHSSGLINGIIYGWTRYKLNNRQETAERSNSWRSLSDIDKSRERYESF